MATRIRLFAAFGALVTAVVLVMQSGPLTVPAPDPVQLRSTFAPLPMATTTIKWPVIDLTDPDPFDPCRDIPFDVIQRSASPSPRPSRRTACAVTTTQATTRWPSRRSSGAPTRKPCRRDAIELDIDGHRAAQFWVMKPTDWNNRWWITCAIAFKTEYGVIQQSLFYAPTYAADDVDCMQTNLQRAHELAPYYKYDKATTE